MTSPRPDDKTQGRRFSPAGRRSFLIFAAVACAIFIAAVVYQWRHFMHLKAKMVGDGQNVASYQFDLSDFRGDRDLLVASGLPKNGQPALDHPRAIDTDAVDRRNRNPHSRVIISRDKVIGVTIDGQARAYPVRVLNWHEVVNDSLAGVPIAVTFSPISRAAVVFDRRLNDQTLRFGFSGLVYQHNLVLHDRRDDPADESLWPQLRFAAIAGPRAGARLRVLPARLVQWGQWREAHPDTTLMLGRDADAWQDRYERAPYERAFATGQTVFPVDPPPPPESETGIDPFAVVAAYQPAPAARPHPGPNAPADADPRDDASATPNPASDRDPDGEGDRDGHGDGHGDRDAPDPRRAPGWRLVTDPAQIPPGRPAAYARYFAWHAQHPRTPAP